jgi:hypothetical protein
MLCVKPKWAREKAFKTQKSKRETIARERGNYVIFVGLWDTAKRGGKETMGERGNYVIFAGMWDTVKRFPFLHHISQFGACGNPTNMVWGLFVVRILHCCAGCACVCVCVCPCMFGDGVCMNRLDLVTYRSRRLSTPKPMTSPRWIARNSDTAASNNSPLQETVGNAAIGHCIALWSGQEHSRVVVRVELDCSLFQITIRGGFFLSSIKHDARKDPHKQIHTSLHHTPTSVGQS